MKPLPTLEDRLQSTGMLLRDRPSVVDRVVASIRRKLADRADEPKSDKEKPRE